MNLKKTFILAFAGAMMLAANAKAATISAHADDLVIAFRDTSGAVAFDLEVDLGNYANPISSIDLSSDLAAVYGSGWASDSTLVWAVVGADLQSQGGNNNIFYSVSGTNSPRTPGSSVSSQTSPAGLINNVVVSGMNNATAFSALGNDLKIANTATNSYQVRSYTGHTTNAFGFLGGASGIETGVVSSGSISAGVWELIPTNSSATAIGTFTLGSNGVLTFTQAIPEPSTYALMGIGSLALVWLRRRKGVSSLA